MKLIWVNLKIGKCEVNDKLKFYLKVIRNAKQSILGREEGKESS